MKKCVRCGKELPDIAGFCRHCGAKQVLEESQQDSGSISSKADLYNKMNWEITIGMNKINSTLLDISSEISDLSQKILEYSIDSLTDYFSDGIDNGYQNSKCPFYPEVLTVLSNAKIKFDECLSKFLLFVKEIKAAILKDTGEDIDISCLYLDENFFTVPPNLNTEDLSEAIIDLNLKISDYSMIAVDLLGMMGDKIDEIMDQLSEQE